MIVFFFIIYGLLSLYIIKLFAITIQGSLTSEDAWLFGRILIPLSVLVGVVMLILSFRSQKYQSELIFELVAFLICFIILTPLTCFAILALRHVPSKDIFNVTFCVYGFVAFIPASIKNNLLVKNYIEDTPLKVKEAISSSITLFVFILISMMLVTKH